MEQEIISAVDEQDTVTGTTTKQESHAHGIPHRVVAVFVRKGDELLVNTRHDTKNKDHSVGGHVRDNETYIDAAVRECAEEIGLSVAQADLIEVAHFFHDETPRTKGLKHWFTLYTVDAPDNFHPIAQEGEVDALEYENMHAIQQRMRENPEQFAYGFLGTMNQYLAKNDPSTTPII